MIISRSRHLSIDLHEQNIPFAGKTSFLHRYVRNRFPAKLESTIGANFLTRTINIDETEVQLQMWDTAGPGELSSLHSP